MALFNKASFNSVLFNSRIFSRTLITPLALKASLSQSFRPPRRMAQSATTRVVRESVGTDRTVERY